MDDVVATRIYLRPLLPPNPIKGMSIDKVLRQTQRDVLRRVKRKLLQTTFSERAKKALAKSIHVVLKPSSLQIVSNHPAFIPLLKGQRQSQMTWLTKAKRPIPIITESGELIFRTATAKSMADGKWVHPGRPPSDFLDKAKEETRNFVKAKLMEEVRKQLRRGLQASGRR